MKQKIIWGFILLSAVFLLSSYFIKCNYGIATSQQFVSVFWSMIKILPCAFILIALFEKWCHRDTVVKHLGSNSGMKGYFLALLLGSMTIGGLFVAFPLAYSLQRKGASLKVIFSFLGFAVMSWSLAFVYILLVTGSNLIPRAVKTHSWYKAKFEDYPKNRKAIFPGIL